MQLQPIHCTWTAELTSVKDLLYDCSHLPLQHGVEQLDYQDEAGAEHQQRESQQDQTHCQVWQIHIHKEMLTWVHRKNKHACICGKTPQQLKTLKPINSDSQNLSHLHLPHGEKTGLNR